MKRVLTCIVDPKYLAMAEVFVGSFLEHASKHIDQVFIGSVGLCAAERARLSNLSAQIEILELESSVSATVLHDKNWLRNVKLKTEFVRQIFDTYEPDELFLCDVDQVVVDYPHAFFKCFADVALVRRRMPMARQEIRMDYIASNVILKNSLKAKTFLDEWIQCLETVSELEIEPPFETLALNIMARRYAGSNLIQDLDEDVVSCVNDYVAKRTSVIHMKSTHRRNIEDLLTSRFMSLPADVRELVIERVPRIINLLSDDGLCAIEAKGGVNV